MDRSFAELVHRFRVRARLTKTALAERARIKRDTIAAWESGVRVPRSEALVSDLADALGLSAAEAELLSTTAAGARWSDARHERMPRPSRPAPAARGSMATTASPAALAQAAARVRAALAEMDAALQRLPQTAAHAWPDSVSEREGVAAALQMIGTLAAQRAYTCTFDAGTSGVCVLRKAVAFGARTREVSLSVGVDLAAQSVLISMPLPPLRHADTERAALHTTFLALNDELPFGAFALQRATDTIVFRYRTLIGLLQGERLFDLLDQFVGVYASTVQSLQAVGYAVAPDGAPADGRTLIVDTAASPDG